MTYREFKTVPNHAQAVTTDGGDFDRSAGVPLWSGKVAPASVGARVRIDFNNLGEATVVGYFVEDGWLGLKVTLADAPEWHRQQRKGDATAHVFGIEATIID